jgi:polyisoprenoid-binding protein YceI
MMCREKMKAALGVLAICAFVVSGKAHAEPTAGRLVPAFQLTLRPGSRLWLTGDSTLHPYASTATVVQLEASFQPSVAGSSASLVDRLSQAEVVAFKLTIPVESLKSGEKGLDKNLVKALKGATFPSIQFRLTDKHLLVGLPSNAASKLTSTGLLTIAGTENEVKIESQIESIPEGIRIFGTKQLLMTDYGVKPPTIMGMIKTKNEVTIHFDMILAPQP